MPSLEITAEKAPADLDAFLKNISALFSECIGKPESVSIPLLKVTTLQINNRIAHESLLLCIYIVLHGHFQ